MPGLLLVFTPEAKLMLITNIDGKFSVGIIIAKKHNTCRYRNQIKSNLKIHPCPGFYKKTCRSGSVLTCLLVAVEQAIRFCCLSKQENLVWEILWFEFIGWIWMLWCMWLAWITCLSQQEGVLEPGDPDKHHHTHKQAGWNQSNTAADSLQKLMAVCWIITWGCVIVFVQKWNSTFPFCLRQPSEPFENIKISRAILIHCFKYHKQMRLRCS